MIRAGILSMQRIANYGSFLQAYGLKHLLEDCGCRVQFVDYHPGKTLIPADSGIIHKAARVMEVICISAPVKEKIRYIKHKKNFAASYLPLLEIGSRRNYRPELDLLVIGSDEVFNCVQNNTSVGFSPELFGDGSNAKRVVTYAASFGNTTFQKLEFYLVKDKVAKWLQKLDAVSVRDANSGAIVKALTAIEPKYHLDPVLAFGFIGKCDSIPDSVPEENYMILYGYTGRFSTGECRGIREYARQRGLKIYCIGGVQKCCDRFIDCDPFRVITYFQYADCVVTDTFHGTILSVITHRSFAVFVRTKDYGNSEKLEDLLARLKLNGRIAASAGQLGSILGQKIDYCVTDEMIAGERKRSERYLKEQVLMAAEASRTDKSGASG